MYSVTRIHDFSAGHRVLGHEGKCAHLHGHNYRAHLTCEVRNASGGPTDLDMLGRVIDFSEIKLRMCRWIDEQWDHRFIVSENDFLCLRLCELDHQGVRPVPFNPTAENMARYLVEVVGPLVFEGTGVRLTHCTIEETRKCSATFNL